MIRTGTTRFWDMYWHPEATARAVADAGLRATIGGAAVRRRRRRPRRCRRRRCDSLDDAGRARAGRSRRALAPHSIYTVSEELLRWIAELGAERELPIQIHLSETEQEVERLPRRPRPAPGRLPRPARDARASAPCSPTASGSTAAELELIAERGCTVVTNPVANMKLAVGGVFPYPAAREAGRRGRPRHRRRRLQRLARPARRPQDLRPGPEPRRRRPDRARRRGGLGDRHRRPRAAARRRRAARRVGAAGRLPAAARRLARARPRRARLRPRLRGQRLGRRHDRRRRPGADARRRGRRASRRSSPGPRSARSASEPRESRGRVGRRV